MPLHVQTEHHFQTKPTNSVYCHSRPSTDRSLRHPQRTLQRHQAISLKTGNGTLQHRVHGVRPWLRVWVAIRACLERGSLWQLQSVLQTGSQWHATGPEAVAMCLYALLSCLVSLLGLSLGRVLLGGVCCVAIRSLPGTRNGCSGVATWPFNTCIPPLTIQACSPATFGTVGSPS